MSEVHVTGNWVQGKRRPEGTKVLDLQRGEYLYDKAAKRWFCVMPDGERGHLLEWLHGIERHEDGTITARSILKGKTRWWVIEKGRWLEVPR